MTADECAVSIDLARGVAMVLKECAVVKHSPSLFENRKTKAEAIFAICMEVGRLQPFEQLADELAEFADHHPPCGRHCSSHDPAPCGCGLDALLAKHATLKGAK